MILDVVIFWFYLTLRKGDTATCSPGWRNSSSYILLVSTADNLWGKIWWIAFSNTNYKIVNVIFLGGGDSKGFWALGTLSLLPFFSVCSLGGYFLTVKEILDLYLARWSCINQVSVFTSNLRRVVKTWTKINKLLSDEETEMWRYTFIRE